MRTACHARRRAPFVNGPIHKVLRYTPHMTSARRTLLFMPGDSARKIEKAATLDADSVVLDLEDAVAVARKPAAREVVRDALGRVDFNGRERLVRVNDLSSGLFQDDVRATLCEQLDGYVLPKVHNLDVLRAAMRFIAECCAERDMRTTEVSILAIIESGAGILNLREIAAAGAPLNALIFGADDYAADVGAIRTRSNTEVLFARSAVVAAAAAHQLHAIDLVFFDLRDEAGLASECQLGRQLGYTGKMVIHPAQIETANRAFSPDETEVAYARRVLDAYAEHQHAGVGAFQLDGRMVDMPIVRQARRVIDAHDRPTRRA
jgi:citrate lyase beta subunit